MVRSLRHNAMATNTHTATDLVLEMVKAANSAYISHHVVTIGLHNVKLIAIRPKMAELYIFK